MFDWFYRRRHRKETAQKIYGSIVAQSRQPAFYEDLGVADSLEGRFEILVIHLFLALAVLPGEKEGQDLRGDLIDLFTADMDATMRELGLSDIRVPKKMRELSVALNERLSAYNRLMERLEKAVLEGELPSSTDIRALARFVHTIVAGMSILARDGASSADLEAVVRIALLGWDAAGLNPRTWEGPV